MDRSYKARLIFEELDGFDQFDRQRFHSAEGFRHHQVKNAIAYLINQAGRDVGLEVETPDGEIDILDAGRSDEGALAIEVQTDCTPQERKDKAQQYTSELIRDVVVIDPTEAPDDLTELESWIRERIPGV